jgi:hypothetical protein
MRQLEGIVYEHIREMGGDEVCGLLLGGGQRPMGLPHSFDNVHMVSTFPFLHSS